MGILRSHSPLALAMNNSIEIINIYSPSALADGQG